MIVQPVQSTRREVGPGSAGRWRPWSGRRSHEQRHRDERQDQPASRRRLVRCPDDLDGPALAGTRRPTGRTACSVRPSRPIMVRSSPVGYDASSAGHDPAGEIGEDDEMDEDAVIRFCQVTTKWSTSSTCPSTGEGLSSSQVSLLGLVVGPRPRRIAGRPAPGGLEADEWISTLQVGVGDTMGLPADPRRQRPAQCSSYTATLGGRRSDERIQAQRARGSRPRWNVAFLRPSRKAVLGRAPGAAGAGRDQLAVAVHTPRNAPDG